MESFDFYPASGKLVLYPTGRGAQVALCVESESGEGFLVDYYDTPEEGQLASEHFSDCYEVALSEGFVLTPGFFSIQRSGALSRLRRH